MKNHWIASLVASGLGFVITEICVVMAIMSAQWLAIVMCMIDASALAMIFGYCLSECLRWERARVQFEKMMRLAEEFEKEQKQ